ncbi:hypothetical protein ONZ45_g15888 [Pleurotus djamor]|nr:hypothetical protein ONZ45_g15888 [Pleurotus djamor]
MLGDDEDVFDSVTWESPAAPVISDSSTPSGPGFRQSTADTGGPHDPKWEGYLITSVKDPVKELAETKDAYVSYLVTAKTNLPIFSTTSPSARRRFQDFVFLRENLSKDFPACVIPPLPEKHRLEYVTGDRFSPEFMERRRADLDIFLQRVSRHPTLQRSALVRAFLESTEWHVHMHHHVAHPPGPEPSPGLIDNLSDTLLNAFSKVRKPDERFLDMRESVDKFEEGITVSDRLWNRIRSRTSGECTVSPFVLQTQAERDGNPESSEDLTADYHDLAVAVQGLGFLESGITDPLNHFSNTLLEFSALLRHTTQTSTDPFLLHLRSLLAYSNANRAVLKLRDQKQLDFEELTDYLSRVTTERDRLSAVIRGHAGSTGLGLGSYLKDRVDAIRGMDDDRSRVERMRKLDLRIRELQDEVTTSHETLDAFSDETLREQSIFQYSKESEMKEMLGNLADGQIEFYKAARKAMAELASVAAKYDSDGITVHFLNSPAVGTNLKSSNEVKRLFDAQQLTSGTPIGGTLWKIVTTYLAKLDAAKASKQGETSPATVVKPLNLIVITDGAPTDDLESVIVAIAKELDSRSLPVATLGVQFVQIGDDLSATQFLENLDDNLRKQYDIRDIVDTTVAEKGQKLDLIKVLIGGINRRVDNKGADAVK